MSTHAERVKEAERAVVEASVARRSVFNESISGRVDEWKAQLMLAIDALDACVDALLSLRAATCPTCGGSGEKFGGYDGFGEPVDVPCPAGCERGRKVGA